MTNTLRVGFDTGGVCRFVPAFAADVFGGVPGFEVVTATASGACDVYVYSHYAEDPCGPVGATRIFVDGESSTDYSAQRGAPLSDADGAHIYIGPRANHETLAARGVRCLDIPFASISFGERRTHSPADLTRRPHAVARARRRFCAYMYSNPVEERERFFLRLREAAAPYGLAVDALGPCDGEAGQPEKLSSRESYDYLDDAVRQYQGYDFVIAYENETVDGYVTEKLVSAYLAGCVPIYFGSCAAMEVFDARSMIFASGFATSDRAIDEVIGLARDRERLSSVVGRCPLQPNALRTTFSWHHDVPYRLAAREIQEQVIAARKDPFEFIRRHR